MSNSKKNHRSKLTPTTLDSAVRPRWKGPCPVCPTWALGLRAVIMGRRRGEWSTSPAWALSWSMPLRPWRVWQLQRPSRPGSMLPPGMASCRPVFSSKRVLSPNPKHSQVKHVFLFSPLFHQQEVAHECRPIIPW
jgi:hypothetical protein